MRIKQARRKNGECPSVLIGKSDRDTGCMEWQRAPDKDGYGRLVLEGKSVAAHRWNYERCVGPIPEGLQIDHLCRNRLCVNPDHLEAVTPAENVRRGITVQLTKHKAREAKRMRRNGITIGRIASMLGVSFNCIADISKGRCWVDA